MSLPEIRPTRPVIRMQAQKPARFWNQTLKCSKQDKGQCDTKRNNYCHVIFP